MNRNNEMNNRPLPIAVFPDTDGYEVKNGERHSLVSIIQIMLDVLRLYYDAFGNLPISGVFDLSTEGAVKEFQRANRLPVTGVVDRATWDALASEYNSALSENQ